MQSHLTGWERHADEGSVPESPIDSGLRTGRHTTSQVAETLEFGLYKSKMLPVWRSEFTA